MGIRLQDRIFKFLNFVLKLDLKLKFLLVMQMKGERMITFKPWVSDLLFSWQDIFKI
jgi:hypothetical protein